jgi:hypothetical protein
MAARPSRQVGGSHDHKGTCRLRAAPPSHKWRRCRHGMTRCRSGHIHLRESHRPPSTAHLAASAARMPRAATPRWHWVQLNPARAPSPCSRSRGGRARRRCLTTPSRLGQNGRGLPNPDQALRDQTRADKPALPWRRLRPPNTVCRQRRRCHPQHRHRRWPPKKSLGPHLEDRGQARIVVVASHPRNHLGCASRTWAKLASPAVGPGSRHRGESRRRLQHGHATTPRSHHAATKTAAPPRPLSSGTTSSAHAKSSV